MIESHEHIDLIRMNGRMQFKFESENKRMGIKIKKAIWIQEHVVYAVRMASKVLQLKYQNSTELKLCNIM